MQGWIVGGAWLFAVLLAIVVLGFAAYEISWKTRRLLADRDRLNLLLGELAAVSAEMQHAAERARSISARPSVAGPAKPFLG
jgi:hypothetical protein